MNDDKKCQVVGCEKEKAWRVRAGSLWSDFCHTHLAKTIGETELDEIVKLPLRTQPKGQ